MPDDRSRRRQRTSLLLAIGALAIILIAIPLALAHHGSRRSDVPGNAKQVGSKGLAGNALKPAKAAPPIDLRSSTGRRVTLRQYRGKPVLVTFLYTHCPDVCPLITAKLHLLQAQYRARARGVPIIAVSVDPRGDTPKSVAGFLAQHHMTGRMQYLLGSAATLGRTWKAWNVGSQRDASNPRLVAHSGLVYGISAAGKLRSVYAANFKPADIAHDLPLLAKS